MMTKSTKASLQRLLKIFLAVLIVLMLLIGVVVWQFASNFVQPPRRALQDYHLQWLQDAKQEGLRITALNCASGKMPCLIVTAANFGNGKSRFASSPDPVSDNVDISNTQPSLENTISPKNENNIGSRGRAVREQLIHSFKRTLTPYAVTAQQPKGIVVLLHGRGGRKEDLLPVAARLVASGFVCVLLDMPAHGDSPLTKSRFGVELQQQTPNLIQQSLVDAKAWLKSQQTQSQEERRYSNTQNAHVNVWSLDELPAFLWGMSMGGSYANYALIDSEETHKNAWQGLIIVSSFAKLEGVVDAQIEQLIDPLPEAGKYVLKPILSHLFAYFVVWQGGEMPANINPAKQALNIDLPVLELHGNKDRVIDIGQGKRLFESYASVDKTWMTVDGAGHNNVLITDAPVYASMADWLLQHSDYQTPPL